MEAQEDEVQLADSQTEASFSTSLSSAAAVRGHQPAEGECVHLRLSSASGLLRANILVWASDGECSQLLCWPLVPCPNSWGHFIPVMGSAGLEPISSHSGCVLSVKSLCAEDHEYWCGIGQCVRSFSVAGRAAEGKKGLYGLMV